MNKWKERTLNQTQASQMEKKTPIDGGSFTISYGKLLDIFHQYPKNAQQKLRLDFLKKMRFLL